eukprot:6932763-Pyramimonas_sp.AAC.4
MALYSGHVRYRTMTITNPSIIMLGYDKSDEYTCRNNGLGSLIALFPHSNLRCEGGFGTQDNVWAQYKCPSQIEYCTNNGRANCYCVTKSLGPASIVVLVALLAIAACACILVCMNSDYLLGTDSDEEGTRLMVSAER